MTYGDSQLKIFCPYCGASSEWESDVWNTVEVKQFKNGSSDGYLVRCLHCDASGPLAKSRGAAVRYWNRRPMFSDILAKRLYNAYFEARQGLDAYGEELPAWKEIKEESYLEWEAWHQVAEWVLSAEWTIRLDEKPTDPDHARSVHSTKPMIEPFDQKEENE